MVKLIHSLLQPAYFGSFCSASCSFSAPAGFWPEVQIQTRAWWFRPWLWRQLGPGAAPLWATRTVIQPISVVLKQHWLWTPVTPSADSKASSHWVSLPIAWRQRCATISRLFAFRLCCMLKWANGIAKETADPSCVSSKVCRKSQKSCRACGCHQTVGLEARTSNVLTAA